MRRPVSLQRRAFLEIPPRVEYHGTEKDRELGDVIAALERFGTKHLSDPTIPAAYNECVSLDEENTTAQGVKEPGNR